MTPNEQTPSPEGTGQGVSADLPLDFGDDAASNLAADLTEEVRVALNVKTPEQLIDIYGTFQTLCSEFLTTHAAQIRRSALEECVRIASANSWPSVPDDQNLDYEDGWNNAAGTIENEIRALASQPLPGKKEGEG